MAVSSTQDSKAIGVNSNFGTYTNSANKLREEVKRQDSEEQKIGNTATSQGISASQSANVLQSS